MIITGCGHKAPPAAPRPEPSKQAPPSFAVKPLSQQDGVAVWYQVPAGSLPERRAETAEMTAASDTLPMGAFARVTRLSNGKSVIVRITDRGIHRRGTLIDVSKPAAEALEMVEKGEAPVRVEELALENASARPPETDSAATKTPMAGASAQTEQQAAAAKSAQ